jgi:Zn-dependent peptidase ImmA (M78 family)
MLFKSPSVSQLMKRSFTKETPINYIRELAQDLVLLAYDKGWSGPPFNPVNLAHLLGYKIKPNNNIVDARTTFDGKDTLIEYNPNQLESRINFSIAHEIAHTFFPDYKERIWNREEKQNLNYDNWEIEFLCNVAASELLLPFASFSLEVNELTPNLNNLINLANKYKASIESVFLRFCEVTNVPCNIIIASFNDKDQTELIVDYSKASKASVIEIEKGFLIPKDSSANECINPGWTSQKKEKWTLFAETYYLVYSIGLSRTKKINSERVGILLVPEFYQNDEKQKLYTVFGDATKPRGLGKKIIVQIVNTSGGLGFGFGKAMAVNWPESKKSVMNWIKNKEDFNLGSFKLTQLDKDIYVFQIIAQKGLFPKKDETPLKYDSLKKGLLELKSIAYRLNASVHMPAIGSGQGKGEWNIIEGMIYEILIQNNIEVTVYLLPGREKIKSKNTTNLILFNDSSLYE